MTPSTANIAIPPPPSWLPGLDADYQVRFLDAKGNVHWESNKGPQTWALLCPFDEILVGGRRGGGKSQWLIAWFGMGDPSLPEDDPAHYSFLNDPTFRGLMLRKEYQSMAEFVDEAMDFFRVFGCKAKDDPTVFHFDSGAKIYTNHLGNPEAYEKYRGWNITKIGVEELTQIPDQRWYLKLMGSLRSKTGASRVRMIGRRELPKLRTQIGSTTNPDGPGACVPYGEVLTASGWKDVSRVAIGDRVWSIDPATGAMVQKTVEQVHCFAFFGQLYEANGRGLHISCTPDHRILRFNTTKHSRNQLVLEEIEKFPGQACVVRSALRWDGSGPSVIEARSMARKRSAKLNQPTQLSVEHYAALVGWMVTEGSLVKRDNALCISQVKPDGRKKLRQLLDDCGFVQNWSARGVLIYSHEWLEHFLWLPHSHDKFIPDWVKNLPVEALQKLIEAMVAGDGTRESSTSGYFFSSSARLAADFSEVALKCGYIVHANGRQRSGGGTIHGRQIIARAYAHEVSYHKQALAGSELRTGNHTYSVETSTARQNVKRVDYAGPVYCIGVPDTHTFIIRQKGCVWISGNCWVKERLVHVLDAQGKPIPWNTPMKDEITGLTRIFVPATLSDNPYLRDDKRYMGMLLSQDEVTRAQWIEGDWDAGTGIYFRDYRPDGPRGQEETDKYPWARHKVAPVQLQTWWYRWGSLDVGYDHPFCCHKFCRNERDRRIHVYDEITDRHVGSFELGVLLAKWWLPELETLPDHQVTMYVSPDAFNKTDATKTRAEQIEDGIKSILGPYGALLMRYNDDERAAMARDAQAAARMFDARRDQWSTTGNLGIAIKPANNDRVGGWSEIRNRLRFRPVLSETEEELKVHLRKVFEAAGVEAYERELQMSKTRKPEVLPQMVLWNACKGADRFLKTAMHDEAPKNEDVRKMNAEDGVGGDDPGDCLRYGVMGFKEVENRMPKGYWVNQEVLSVQEHHKEAFGEEITDPTRLAMIRATQAARYEKQNPSQGGGTLTLPRQSSHRWVQ